MCIKRCWRGFNLLIVKALIILTLHKVILFPGTTVQLTPYLLFRMKNSGSEWFNGEISERIHTRDKMYKKPLINKILC